MWILWAVWFSWVVFSLKITMKIILGMAGRNSHIIQFLVGDKMEFPYTPVFGG